MKKRIMLRHVIDSSKLFNEIELKENDSNVKFGRIYKFEEKNDSQVLILGRCFVSIYDYETVKKADKDSYNYTITKKWLIDRSSYSEERYRLHIDNIGNQYIKRIEFREQYLLGKELINHATITNLNIWVNSKKQGNRKRLKFYLGTFGTFATALYASYGLILYFYAYPIIE